MSNICQWVFAYVDWLAVARSTDRIDKLCFYFDCIRLTNII